MLLAGAECHHPVRREWLDQSSPLRKGALRGKLLPHCSQNPTSSAGGQNTSVTCCSGPSSGRRRSWTSGCAITFRICRSRRSTGRGRSRSRRHKRSRSRDRQRACTVANALAVADVVVAVVRIVVLPVVLVFVCVRVLAGASRVVFVRAVAVAVVIVSVMEAELASSQV